MENVKGGSISILIVFALLSSFSADAAHPCAKKGTGFRSCKELIQYRKWVATEKDRLLLRTPAESYIYNILRLEENLSTLRGFEGFSIFQTYRDILHGFETEWKIDPTRQKLKDLVAAATLRARDYVDEIEQKRQEDLETLLHAMSELKLEYLSIEDVRRAVGEFHQHMLAVQELIRRRYSKRAENPEYIEYHYIDHDKNHDHRIDESEKGWIRLLIDDPFQEIFLLTKKRSQVPPRAHQRDFKKALLSPEIRNFLTRKRNGKLRTKKEVFQFLVSLASVRDRGQSFAEGLTPYHARMVLMFHFRKKVPVRYADFLAKHIKLKINVSQISPAQTLYDLAPEEREKKLEVLEGSWENSFRTSIFHDGYFAFAKYGARPDVAVRLNRILGEEFFSHCGRGCFDYLTKVYQALGFEPSLRQDRDAADFIKPRQLVQHGPSWRFEGKVMDFKKPLFNALIKTSKEPICSESELEPGDLLFSGDQVQLFTGYEIENGFAQPKIIRARGDYFKNVAHITLDLYPDFLPPDQGLQAEGCRSSIFTTSTKPYYRGRLEEVIEK